MKKCYNSHNQVRYLFQRLIRNFKAGVNLFFFLQNFELFYLNCSRNTASMTNMTGLSQTEPFQLRYWLNDRNERFFGSKSRTEKNIGHGDTMLFQIPYITMERSSRMKACSVFLAFTYKFAYSTTLTSSHSIDMLHSKNSNWKNYIIPKIGLTQDKSVLNDIKSNQMISESY